MDRIKQLTTAAMAEVDETMEDGGHPGIGRAFACLVEAIDELASASNEGFICDEYFRAEITD